jgi:predicted TIM-barrel fold metal-dependent hydrolase
MALELQDYIFIDNHAHSLIRGHLQFDEISFRKAFSEGNSLALLQDHLPSSLFYMDLLSKLEEFLQVRGEQVLMEYRARERDGEYVRDLWDDVSIAGMIVDDGYRTADTITLRQLSELSGRPIYRCVRLESVLEDSINGANNFDELKAIFELALNDDQSSSRIVAWKTIAAYRGGLGIEHVNEDFARADFDRVKQIFDDGNTRLEICPLYHWFLLRAFDWAGERSIPVQVHCGMGDDDADLRSSSPVHLRSVLKDKRFARTKFVLLHCYPFVSEAAFLCSLYPNVFMDLSLSCTLASPLLDRLFTESIAVAPTSKVLAGTDGHSVPEAHWYGALTTKNALQRSLNTLIDNLLLTERNAADAAARILHDNARQLYGLEDLL